MVRLIGLLGLVVLTSAIATGEPYWIEWHARDWPDNVDPPWERNWGNWYGQYQGGAYRTLKDGVLTYDSLYDPGVFDGYEMDRSGATDPAPGEVFVFQWTARVDQLYGGTYDTCIALCSDTAKCLGLGLAPGYIKSVFEDGVTIPIEPAVFHEYTVVSSGMITYNLYIDGQLTRVGSFWQGVGPSYVAWGDCVQGAASLHRWKRVAFGVVPGPLAADVNCDGIVDFHDINPFVQALVDPDGYRDAYRACWPLNNADVNGDGTVNFTDINPFVAVLVAG
jgi:hypothetical protein